MAMGEEQQISLLEEGELADGSSPPAAETAAAEAWWSQQLLRLRFDDMPPRRICHLFRQFRQSTNSNDDSTFSNGSGGSNSNKNNFLKGVKWSPDGSSFLTCSDDNTLRSFPLPDDTNLNVEMEHDKDVEDGQVVDSMAASLIVREAETVYDYCWYPFMSALDPTTCVFAGTTRDHPIHLWDAITGQLRCTYRAYDAMDEITAALSVSFNSSATKLFAGYNKYVRVFDVHRPGRDFVQHSLLKGDECPIGIVSSIAFSPSYSGLLAVGSYTQTTALYREDNMELLYVLHGQAGGVTQVLFSKDGNYLYTGGRKDPYILCWDIRNTVSLVYKLYRCSEDTNQRIAFDIEPCGRHLGTGGQDGLIHIYDLQSGQWVSDFQAAQDTVNGFCFHPSLPMAAASSGNRRFSMPDNSDESLNLKGNENCVSIWSFSYYYEPDNTAKASDGAVNAEADDLAQNKENP